MKMWVDADACPVSVKKTLFKASKRTGIELTLVANHSMSVPASPLVTLYIVPQGFDVADNYIEQHIESGDVLVTQDIPLAADAVEKGAHVLNPRGDLYTPENIKHRLRMRNMAEILRNAGQLDGGGPPAFSATDQRQFANALDRLLTKYGSC
ncbi:MAG: YaiI/YqxD family protein [Pseudomonadota bacterium]